MHTPPSRRVHANAIELTTSNEAPSKQAIFRRRIFSKILMFDIRLFFQAYSYGIHICLACEGLAAESDIKGALVQFYFSDIQR